MEKEKIQEIVDFIIDLPYTDFHSNNNGYKVIIGGLEILLYESDLVRGDPATEKMIILRIENCFIANGSSHPALSSKFNQVRGIIKSNEEQYAKEVLENIYQRLINKKSK